MNRESEVSIESSVKTKTVSDINVNPDGTIFYLCPLNRHVSNQSANYASNISVEEIALEDLIINQNWAQYGVLMPFFGSDDQALFYSYEDIPDLVQGIIANYNANSLFFSLATILIYIVELINFYAVFLQLQNYAQYKFSSLFNQSKQVFFETTLLTILLFNILYSTILVTLSLIAISRKCYRSFAFLSTLYFIGVFEIILISLIKPQFSIFIALYRLGLYYYAKFLAHMILNLLLLPR